MDCRKKLSELDQELTAVSTRIMMMGGVLVPYEKLAASAHGAHQTWRNDEDSAGKDSRNGLPDQGPRRRIAGFSRRCMNNEEVYLCWKLGEDRIRFYHRQDEGFAGRKPLDPRDLGPGDHVQ